jgi:hypothetical protein
MPKQAQISTNLTFCHKVASVAPWILKQQQQQQDGISVSYLFY